MTNRRCPILAEEEARIEAEGWGHFPEDAHDPDNCEHCKPAPRPVRYRGYTISYNPKPIPTRAHDYDFVHDDYDGAPLEHADGPPGDDRAGSAASVAACKREIDELEDEEDRKR